LISIARVRWIQQEIEDPGEIEKKVHFTGQAFEVDIL